MIHPAQIEAVTTAEGIAEMAELDAKLFGPHKALSPAELLRIGQHGLLLGIRDDAGVMVAEAQLITEPIPGADEPLVRLLPNESGYFEGFAVTPAYNGQGLGLGLVQAVSRSLGELGKSDVWATVRTENAPSLKNLFKAGYQVIGHAKDYYPGSDRLVVWRSLLPRQVQQPGQTTDAVIIEVQPGDEVDLVANKRITSLLAAGFVGVNLQRNGDKTVLLFQQPAAGLASIIKQKQTFMHDHGIA